MPFDPEIPLLATYPMGIKVLFLKDIMHSELLQHYFVLETAWSRGSPIQNEVFVVVLP